MTGDTGSGLAIVSGRASGPVVACAEGLSFWGGVDPATGTVIDAHHPLHGQCLSGALLTMPTSRGSCSGSGVLLELVLGARAPAALLFREPESVLTLGALVAREMFGRTLPVLRLPPDTSDTVAGASWAEIDDGMLRTDRGAVPLAPLPESALGLSPRDQALLAGEHGPTAAEAMRIVCAVAASEGAERLIDVTRVHVDGCIYASPANLVFAERMAKNGARVVVPTTMNAISVDHARWRTQGVPAAFGEPAAALADAYLRMGCHPTFTCAPYLLEDAPARDEPIAWAESNAAIFANSVLGARTAKHPDFLDLCIALTGRAPLSGPYTDEGRRPHVTIAVEMPARPGSAFWPLLGYLAGGLAQGRIPLLTGLAEARPTRDDLKALCAAFGTTGAAPMLHIAGITPEAPAAAEGPVLPISLDDLRDGWRRLNDGPEAVDLVAVGSPHASLGECRALLAALKKHEGRVALPLIVTAGRDVIAQARGEGTLAALESLGVSVLPDLCWCSITEPVFPTAARTVLTDSGKYAHYGPGLSGRRTRLGALADCADAAFTGRAPPRLPPWLEER